MDIDQESINFLDVTKYWMTLYPEINDIDELEKTLFKVSGKKLVDFESNYNAINEIFFNVDEIFDFKVEEHTLTLVNKFENEVPYFHFYLPLVCYHLSHFLLSLKEIRIIYNIDNFICNILYELFNILVQLAQRTLILETNIARIDGLLIGHTSQQRFHYFAKVMLQNDSFLKNMYREYPVLLDLMSKKTTNYFNLIKEILSNTEMEITHLSDVFNGGLPLGKIKKITTGAGDTHSGGKTVSVIIFDSEYKIVYKPHSLELDQSFQVLLEWIENKEIKGMLNFKKVRTYTKNNYGWMEYINFKECNNEEQMKNFYVRSGQLLCILYAINARDCHFENIIAHKDFPVLIDIETIFHAKPFYKNEDEISSEAIANITIDNSVQTIGFLPNRITNRLDYSDESINIGGIGAEEDQLSPFKSPFIKDGNLDTIRIGKERGIIKTQNNSPKLNGKVAKSDYFIEDIKSGFSTIYYWITNNKKEFIDILYKLFNDKRSRYIFRPTIVYYRLYQLSLHPDFLRDNIHRKVLLYRVGINIKNTVDRSVLTAEFGDMLNGDIPYFAVNINSNILLDSKNNETKFHFNSSPFDSVKEKVSNFNESDLQMQLSLIDISFLNVNKDIKKNITNVEFSTNANRPVALSKEWLSLAINIGEYVINNSITGIRNNIQDRTWIGTILEGIDEKTWACGNVGCDLYNGNSGITLFLAYLGLITNRKDFRDAAIESLQPVISAIKKLDKNHQYLVGSFNGLSGFFYSIFHVGKIFNNKSLLNFISENLDLLTLFIKKDKAFDVIGGAAGCLGVILSIYENTEDLTLKKQITVLARKCLDHLKDSMVYKYEDCIAWESEFSPASTGFAHGNAGIIAYLAKLNKILPDEDIFNLVRMALNFERTLFSRENNNWYSTINRDNISNGWCHGAPGILLGKLILKESGYIDNLLDKEIEIALTTTQKYGFGSNYSYCHGDIGNLAIVKKASFLLNNIDLNNKCCLTFNDLYQKGFMKKCILNKQISVEPLGLMVGLSGIGFSLLRNHSPEAVKEILWLE